MTTRFKANKCLVIALGIVGSAVVLFGAQQGQKADKKGHKVEITKDAVLIHPTVKLSPADEKAMDKVLSGYEKKLYKIETLKHGKVIKTRGSLPAAFMNAQLKAEVSKAKAEGADDTADQANCPNPCHPDGIHATDSDRATFIQKLAPILKKY